MDRLTGIAKNVRHTVHVSAEGRRTDHLALFEIGGTRLSFRGSDPVSIEEGDDLVVVWEPGEKGVGHVLAFDNRTLDVRDHEVRAGGFAGCGCSALFSVIVFVPLGVMAVSDRSWSDAVLPFAIVTVGVVLYFLSRRAEREQAALTQEVEELLDG
jgi:hypothetical protein